MAQDAVSIKGTKQGLVIILNPGYSFEELKNDLLEKIVSARGFFTGAEFTFMPSRITSAESRILEEICQEHGLIPNNEIKFPGDSDSKPKIEQPVLGQPFETQLPSDASNCLLLEHGIRSGQTVQYDGHITVLGDVNAGGELIASGNILVMGALRGIAHAGVLGDEKSVIVAHRMKAKQLRISKVVGRSAGESNSHNYPEIARMVDGRILIEPYTTGTIGPSKKKALF
ncbi:MAG: septum site-determining protein MinC [Bacillota bacterium]